MGTVKPSLHGASEELCPFSLILCKQCFPAQTGPILLVNEVKKGPLLISCPSWSCGSLSLLLQRFCLAERLELPGPRVKSSVERDLCTAAQSACGWLT